MASLNAQKQQSAKKNNTLILVCVIVAAVLVIGLCTYNTLSTNGFFLRHTTAASSEHYKVSNATVSYFFYTNYRQFLNQYGYYASMLGLDQNKSLKSQPCGMMENGGSWFDYFMNASKSTLEQAIYFAEEANARGLTYDDAAKKEVNDSIKLIEDQAKEEGVSLGYYISYLYGTGMKKKDVVEALKLTVMAAKGYNAVESELSFKSDDYKKYADEQGDALMKIDYAMIAMNTADSYAEGNMTMDKIKSYVTKFESAKTKSAFENLAMQYLKEAYKGDTTYTDQDYTDSVASLTYEKASYSEGDEFSEWAFASGRKVGDVKTTVDEEGGQALVYLMLKTKALDTSSTVNFRHILVQVTDDVDEAAAKAKAESILAEYNGGAKTAETFAALAEQYSEDGGSNRNGGLYENVLEGSMVDAVNDWIFASGRKVGDVELVTSEDYGAHILYFAGNGLTAWEASAKSALTQQAMDDAYNALKEKYTVTLDEKVMNSLPA